MLRVKVLKKGILTIKDKAGSEVEANILAADPNIPNAFGAIDSEIGETIGQSGREKDLEKEDEVYAAG